jgi:penicillin G amidase
MKLLKPLLIIIVSVVLLLVAGFFLLKSQYKPTYSGELALDGLKKPVEVFYTEHGIPHIYAQSDEDAYYALGYVHAQDRLFQMDLVRRVGGGRLSEIFGKDLIKADQFLRTLGLAEYARESAEEYLKRSDESLPLVLAYVDGINAFIEKESRTLEHRLLGIQMEPYTVQHVFEVITYMAFSFANAHHTDPVLTDMYARLDSSYVADLMPYTYPAETKIGVFDERFSALSRNTTRMLAAIQVPQFIGSNSWVIGPDKTTTGRVIFANDPHIGYAQPSVWYEAHMVTPTREYYGYHLAGCPFPPVLHTEKFAIGLTMFENDDMDFYVEKLVDNSTEEYWHKNEKRRFEISEQTIKVKKGDDVPLKIRKTIHGPVVSDVLQDDTLNQTVSMYWVTTNFPNKTLEVLHQLVTANRMDDVELGASMIHGPGLNVMYGDADGNVAWWAAGKLIVRQDEATSKTFYEGWTGENDPDAHYPFEKNPRSINPPWGYVYSANNQPEAVDGIHYSGYYLPDDRASRIVEMLSQKEKYSVDDVKAQLLDTKSMTFERIRGYLMATVKDTEHTDLLLGLLKWDATFRPDDWQPVFFQKWLYEILAGAMKDELGATLWMEFIKSHQFKYSIPHLVLNEKSRWWDDVTTDEKETRDIIISRAFDKTYADLKADWGKDHTAWRWGKVHSVTHRHAMSAGLGFLARWFSVGPLAAPGGSEVVNNIGFDYTGEKQVNITFGPSTRRVVDFSDVRNNSWSILPTGQSGNQFSPYYQDQAQMYINGEFRKMRMDHEGIKASENKLVLKPAK